MARSLSQLRGSVFRVSVKRWLNYGCVALSAKRFFVYAVKDEGWLANWMTVWQANKLRARMATDTALMGK